MEDNLERFKKLGESISKDTDINALYDQTIMLFHVVNAILSALDRDQLDTVRVEFDRQLTRANMTVVSSSQSKSNNPK